MPNSLSFFPQAPMISLAHNPQAGFTLRIVSPTELDGEACQVVHDTVLRVADDLEFGERGMHAFVTLLPGTSLSTDTTEEPGLGLYMIGIQAVTIAGYQPDHWDRQRWLRELRITVAHELFHYCQEVRGRDIDEDEAEAFGQQYA